MNHSAHFPFHKDHMASRGLKAWVRKRRRDLQARLKDSHSLLASYDTHYVCMPKHLVKISVLILLQKAIL